MRKTLLITLMGSVLLLGGCSDQNEKEANPTFMFWCFRKEIVSTDYHVPDMSTAAVAAYLQDAIKRDPGYVDSSYDLDTHILSVRYKSSTSRKMNYEELIASRGFPVNNRPAHPNAKIPEGLQ
jgi:hypothetical protein